MPYKILCVSDQRIWADGPVADLLAAQKRIAELIRQQQLGIRRCYVVDAGFPINPNEGCDILLTFPSARVRKRIRRLR